MSDMFSIITRVKAVKTFKGIDSQGANSIVFILKNKPKFELKTTKIISRIVERPNEYRLFISLTDDNEISNDIFSVLTEDMLSCVENATTEQQVLEILASRFNIGQTSLNVKENKWMKNGFADLLENYGF